MKMNKIKKAICVVLILFGLMLFMRMQFDLSAQNISPNREVAQAEELERLRKDGVRAGTYSVKIVYADGEQVIEEIVLLTIKDEHTVIQDQIAIDAHNATIDVQQVAEMTSEKWIEITEARAWNVKTQEVVNITGVNSSQIKSEVGTYQLYFVTLNNVQTAVDITVTSSEVENSHFINQQYSDWSNEYYAEQQPFLSTFMNIILYIVSFLLMLVILIPFFFLLVEYLVTSKIVHQIINIITK